MGPGIDTSKWPSNKGTPAWVLLILYWQETNSVTRSVYRQIIERRIARGDTV